MPIEGLQNVQLVEKLIEILNTEPPGRNKSSPALTFNHYLWADRLLTRITGLRVADPDYAHYTGPWVSWNVHGPQWKRIWTKYKTKVKIQPIRVPGREKFVWENKDRQLLLSDFDAWQSRVTFKPPLIRTKLPTYVGKYILADLEITLTNATDKTLILSTKPCVTGVSGHNYGSGGSLSTEHFECISHKGKFGTVKAGESMRWKVKERLHYWGEGNKTWLLYRLIFQRGGENLKAWRGVVRTPWISIKKEGIVERN